MDDCRYIENGREEEERLKLNIIVITNQLFLKKFMEIY